VTRLKGLQEDDPDFNAAVETRLEARLAALSARNPAFAQVLRAYHRTMQAGDFGGAQGLLGWLAGQPHIGRAITAKAGVKGSVDGQAALAFLRGLLLVLRQSGHSGLVVILDEVETLQRMNAQTREKSLNALRQLVDMLSNDELPGLYLVVTGTPDFFDGYKGLSGLAPLKQRVETRFDADPRFDNLRAPQVRLLPFDQGRLLEVGRRVRSIFPARHAPERIVSRVTDAFLEALVDQVSSGFGGRVEVAPRYFLRELVDVLDRVDQYEDYVPQERYRLALSEAIMTPEELDAYVGGSGAMEDPGAGVATGEERGVAQPAGTAADQGGDADLATGEERSVTQAEVETSPATRMGPGSSSVSRSNRPEVDTSPATSVGPSSTQTRQGTGLPGGRRRLDG